MSETKPVKNKLDPFRDRLRDWAAEGKTLAQIVQQLAADGCKSSLSSVGEYLQRMRDRDADQNMFRLIAQGGEMSRQLQEAFEKNPEPALALLIQNQQVIAMRLQIEGAKDPTLLKLSNRLVDSTLEYFASKTKAEIKLKELEQNDRRIKVLESNAAAAKEKLNDVLKPGAGGLTPETLAKIEEAAKLL